MTLLGLEKKKEKKKEKEYSINQFLIYRSARHKMVHQLD